MKAEIVKVNNTDIECPYEKGQHFVAIKPICQALGIDHQKQFERIKTDRKLSQLYTDTVYSSSSDGKQRKMVCLPLKYVFGWLFSIDESKVSDKAKDAFAKYKDECYDALYERFYLRSMLYEKKQKAIDDASQEIEDLAKTIKEKKEKLVKIKATPVSEFTQTVMVFE